MAKKVDVAKKRDWEDRLRRCSRSGMTIGAFCRFERVSEASFYYWRKRIEGPAKEASFEADGKAGRFRPVDVVQSAPTVEVQFEHGAKLQVHGNQLDVVRAIVGELVRSDPPC
jgi:hypothetical protein